MCMGMTHGSASLADFHDHLPSSLSIELASTRQGRVNSHQREGIFDVVCTWGLIRGNRHDCQILGRFEPRAHRESSPLANVANECRQHSRKTAPGGSVARRFPGEATLPQR
jgi:hypothetical protein